MDKKSPQPPAYITKNDPENARKFGKILFDKVTWTDLSTKELMEIYQLFMWYNQLPKKLEDNIMEPTLFQEAPKAQPEPSKKTPSRKKS